MTAHDSEALLEDERTILLDPCACGHTLNDHGSLAGCWTCGDGYIGDDRRCDVSCETLIAERVARIVADRTAALAEERDRLAGKVARVEGLAEELAGYDWPEAARHYAGRIRAALGDDAGRDAVSEAARGSLSDERASKGQGRQDERERPTEAQEDA